MKLKTILGMIAFVFFLAAVSRGDGTSVSQFPKAVLPVTSFKFQEIIEGTEVVHDFTILNKGAAPLHIKKVETG